MASVPLPANVFCCMDLRLGGKVIASICAMISVPLYFIIDEFLQIDHDEILREISGDDKETLKKLKETQPAVTMTAAILWVLILALFISSLNLFTAIKQEVKKRMIPFIVTLGVLVLLTTVSATLQTSAKLFFVVLTVDAVLIYFWLCVWALYKRFEAAELIQSDSCTE